jgi:hypothetical protein
MKRILVLVAALGLLSVTASADTGVSGEVTLSNGSKILRIGIGGNNGDVRELNMRIQSLERAVSDLQAKVYELSMTPRQQEWDCSLTSNFHNTYTGRGKTRVEAAAAARQACADKEDGMFCQGAPQCEQE